MPQNSLLKLLTSEPFQIYEDQAEASVPARNGTAARNFTGFATEQQKVQKSTLQQHEAATSSCTSQIRPRQPLGVIGINPHSDRNISPPKREPRSSADDHFDEQVKEIHANLVELLPHEDPNHLLRVANRYRDDDHQLTRYVPRHLNREDPKDCWGENAAVAASGASEDLTLNANAILPESKRDEVLSYTEDFSVEEFVRELPDPFKHFQDTRRRCNYDPRVLAFLINVFNNKQVAAVKRYYGASGYNMTTTAQRLLADPSTMQRRIRKVEMSDFGIKDPELLKEMSFVRHMGEIRKYLGDKKTKE